MPGLDLGTSKGPRPTWDNWLVWLKHLVLGRRRLTFWVEPGDPVEGMEAVKQS